MSKKTQAANWVLPLVFLGLTTDFAGRAPAFAGEGKDKPKTAEEEAKEAAQEDADEIADRLAGKKGKRQRLFRGTFLLPSDPTDHTNPSVVGTFVTDDTDKNPGKTYLVKVEAGNDTILETLKRCDAKKVEAQGKLQNQGKYLVIWAVAEPAPGPAAVERRARGGI